MKCRWWLRIAIPAVLLSAIAIASLHHPAKPPLSLLKDRQPNIEGKNSASYDIDMPFDAAAKTCKAELVTRHHWMMSFSEGAPGLGRMAVYSGDGWQVFLTEKGRCSIEVHHLPPRWLEWLDERMNPGPE